jgi:hypothetical protein
LTTNYRILSTIFFLAAIICSTLIIGIYGNENKLVLNVVTPSCGENVNPGEYIYFHGQVTIDGEGVSGVSVVVHIVSPKGGYHNGTRISDSDGYFTYPVRLGEDAIPGKWPVLIKADLAGYEGDSKDCYLLVGNEQVEQPEETETPGQSDQIEETLDEEATEITNQTEIKEETHAPEEILETEKKPEIFLPESEIDKPLLPTIDWTIILVVLIFCVTIITIVFVHYKHKKYNTKTRKGKA